MVLVGPVAVIEGNSGSKTGSTRASSVMKTRNTTLWFAIGGMLNINSELAWVVEIRIGLRLFWYSLGKLVIERDGVTRLLAIAVGWRLVIMFIYLFVFK